MEEKNFAKVIILSRMYRSQFKQLYIIRWEFISKVIGNEETASPVDWFVETKGQSFRHTQLKKYLADIAANDRTKMPISYSDMTHLDALLLPDITARSKNYYLWIEESNAILRDDDEWVISRIALRNEPDNDTPFFRANLSDEYYGRIVQSYVTRTYVTLEWERFLSLPEKNQTLERVDILLCQSIEPSTPIYPKDISDSLDNIARLVRESIAKDHPDLSINNKKFAEEASSWKNEILYDNKWSPRESMIIILSLCETMFGRMGFDGNVRTFGPPPTIDEVII